jgi:methyltransferase (TIGR00027 family)
MRRAGNDTWDLASSVGATATMVAAARAVATRSPDPLISDPFAEPLVKAVGIDFFARLAGGELQPSDIDDDAVRDVQQMTDAMAVRTRYFDQFFTQAASAGTRQAVILASGLDTRAYRLRWPAETTVFEIDQPEVIEFKTATLTDLGVTPTADCRAVPADLRQDWPARLRQAGFDADRPTAWIAEGLLHYLAPDAKQRLLENITALSAVGSRLALDNLPPLPPTEQDRFRQRIGLLLERWQSHGLDVDMTEMVYLDEHNDVAEYLDTHGWDTLTASTSDLFAANGLAQRAENDDDRAPFAVAAYISATLKVGFQDAYGGDPGAPLPLVALPRAELLTVNSQDIPMIKDALGPASG